MAFPAADIDLFFDSLLAVSASYTGTGAAKTISILFDEAYSGVEIGGTEYMNTAPVIICKASDITDISLSATFVISSVTYKVREYHPADAAGMQMVILTKD